MQLSPAEIGGAISSGIVAVGILIRQGLLRISIGKNGVTPKNGIDGINGKNGAPGKDSNSSFNPEDCKKIHEQLSIDREKRWSKLDETIHAWDKINQTLILENQARKMENVQQAEQLKEGKQEFKEIRKDMGKFETGLTVLLERTGGTPKDWHKD